MRASVRQMLADHIERMIDLLDTLDGDADMEPDCDDEPSLAYAVYHPAVGWTLSDDREGDDSDYGEDPRLCPPGTLNPKPIRAKRVCRRQAA